MFRPLLLNASVSEAHTAKPKMAVSQ
ncbi:uncharacterized protein METZ01_LOCUS389484 [marine metagenome]|uniref:Uncharacterized protein n=1 Tax=marine metagenome TaxID=408172 RepID=A0A382UQZ9_9ZZZZ